MSEANPENTWGLLPHQVRERLLQREWRNRRNFRQRLIGERPFPIQISLKPPGGAEALAELARLQTLQEQWRTWPRPEEVRWESRQFRQLGHWQLPVALRIDSMQSLLDCLGGEALALALHWQKVMAPLLALDHSLFPTLTRHLETLEQMREQDAQLLARLLPQLREGLGGGQYLRALPLTGVDTKFVESWQPLISSLLDELHQGAVGAAGGLVPWLDCRENPKGWLLVRPLCPQVRARLGGLPLLQLDATTLEQFPLPAGNILLVENRQSSPGTGLGLPLLADTIAISGSGRNLAWMRAPWLAQKRIGYWGDLDSWGLTLLADARRHQPHVESLMMDMDTLERFREFGVEESTPQTTFPPALTEEERGVWKLLQSGGKSIRLEQERLPQDFVHRRLQTWCPMNAAAEDAAAITS
ncbi:hypothetical protein GNX18_12340 [Microbulbifer sp. SH-1]|uniref:DUF3322 domain-containing protein n=1 Tax=Microbulbifer sp. SH-1 TaxID=2681547 RepID=UPI00140A1666|nr:DUF3322 domain-containing protein [Microbulbifer sp. SH-1]QIL90455.1 hypothetical protein GNX18_12340 [Microbulbifer sp. SH-1]